MLPQLGMLACLSVYESCMGSSCVKAMMWDSLVESLFVGLCYGSEIVDDVLLEVLFLWRCLESQSVDDVLVEAVL